MTAAAARLKVGTGQPGILGGNVDAIFGLG